MIASLALAAALACQAPEGALGQVPIPPDASPKRRAILEAINRDQAAHAAVMAASGRRNDSPSPTLHFMPFGGVIMEYERPKRPIVGFDYGRRYVSPLKSGTLRKSRYGVRTPKK